MPDSWILRPIVWFTAASMVTTMLHELAHVCVAYALGVGSTLFGYFAHLDPGATMAQTTLIRVAGPLSCLVLGLLAWLAFGRTRPSAAGLPLLYFAVFGTGTFFGNLMSIAFVGDFSSVALALGLPMGVRYTLAIMGALSVAAIHFLGGRELVHWVPAGAGRLGGIAGIIVLPVVLGTAAVILVNHPLPRAFVAARFAEAAFWLFGMLGALTAGDWTRGVRGRSVVRWGDIAVVFVMVVLVRLMVRGIVIRPPAP